MWAIALDLYLSLKGLGASGRVAIGALVAIIVSEEFSIQVTAISYCKITNINNT
jgi:hypothetical protein